MEPVVLVFEGGRWMGFGVGKEEGGVTDRGIDLTVI